MNGSFTLKLLCIFQILSTSFCGLIPPVDLNGSTSRGGRIAGGTPARRNQFPFQAILFLYVAEGQSICGGSILSTNYVISAAHCFEDMYEADLLAGVLDVVNDVALYEHSILPSDVTVHNQYNRVTYANDIAVVSTRRLPIIFSTSIQPIQMIPRLMANTNLVGQISTVSGWGRTSDLIRDISEVLMFVNLEIIANDVCARTYGSIVTSGNMCTSGENQKSSCEGDSGGPLTILSGSQTYLAGIVSFGAQRGCQVNQPAVFTRISAFHGWIQTATGIVIP